MVMGIQSSMDVFSRLPEAPPAQGASVEVEPLPCLGIFERIARAELPGHGEARHEACLLAVHQRVRTAVPAVILRHVGRDRVAADPILGLVHPEVEAVRMSMQRPGRPNPDTPAPMIATRLGEVSVFFAPATFSTLSPSDDYVQSVQDNQARQRGVRCGRAV